MVQAAASRALFEQAIVDDPDDRAAWQAYADWLTEQGDPHGELMQVQLALEECEPQRRPQLEERFETLLRENRTGLFWADIDQRIEIRVWLHERGAALVELARDLGKELHIIGLEFRRGWIYSVDGSATVPYLGLHASYLASILEFPAARLVQAVSVFNPAVLPGTLPPQCTCWPRLRKFRCVGWFDAEMERSCRRMVHLVHLAADWNEHSAAVVAELPRLKSFEYIPPVPLLHEIPPAPAAPFTPTPELARITTLDLQRTEEDLGDALRSPHLANVKRLTLRGDEASRAALQRSGITAQLEALTLMGGVYAAVDCGAELAEFRGQLAVHPEVITPEAEQALLAVFPAAAIERAAPTSRQAIHTTQIGWNSWLFLALAVFMFVLLNHLLF